MADAVGTSLPSGPIASPPSKDSQHLRIEDYALIGDCETAALVGTNGSIDWLCLPRFDSPACFAALLGTDQHGYWRIAPSATAEGHGQAQTTRRYQNAPLILETDWQTPPGPIRVTDFMPPRDGRQP